MNSSFLSAFLLILLACCWGPSFLFIKVAIPYLDPITLTLFRIGVAVILLYLVLKFKGINLPKFGKIWQHFAILGLIGSSIPFSLFNFAEQYISSSLAAILNGMVPLFTIVLAHFSTDNDRLSKSKFWGAIIGFGGLLILVIPKLFEAKATILGVFAILVAVTCYSISFVYSKKNLKGVNPLVSSTSQLMVGTLFLLPLSLIFGNPFNIIYLPILPILAVLSLAFFGTACAFILFYKIIEMASASYVSMVNYMIPIVGMILGIVVLGEDVNLTSIIGCFVIVIGVMSANGVFRKIFKSC